MMDITPISLGGLLKVATKLKNGIAMSAIVLLLVICNYGIVMLGAKAFENASQRVSAALDRLSLAQEQALESDAKMLRAIIEESRAGRIEGIRQIIEEIRRSK